MKAKKDLAGYISQFQRVHRRATKLPQSRSGR